MRRMMTEKEIATVESLRKDGIASLKDAQGNPRFVEGDITMETIEGVTQTYGKWSLSGTHLMIVLRGNIVNGTVLPSGSILAFVNLPDYINNKIVNYPNTNTAEYKTLDLYDSSNGRQQAIIRLSKTSTSVSIQVLEPFTLTANRSFRIQFDLLIDTDN